MQRSIVCGIDRSPSSRPAARVAARLARTLGLRCVLAHVTEDRPTFPYRDRRLGELQRRRAIEDGQRLLTEVVAELPDTSSWASSSPETTPASPSTWSITPVSV